MEPKDAQNETEPVPKEPRQEEPRDGGPEGKQQTAPAELVVKLEAPVNISELPRSHP